MKLVFFNHRHAALKVGAWGMFAGTVGEYRGEKQFAHPDMHLLDGADDDDDWARALIPIYPASKDVSSWVIQKSVKLLLGAPGQLGELWSTTRSPRRSAPGTACCRCAAALLDIHRPTTHGRRRARRAPAQVGRGADPAAHPRRPPPRRRAGARHRAGPGRAGGLLDAVDAALPFALTEGQREVGEELAAELDRDQPMHRLLQGEVGSGKTVVALRAMAQVVDAGGQAALLAPTEVLAAQHARGIRALLGPLGRAGELDGDPAGTRVTLLTGSQKAAARAGGARRGRRRPRRHRHRHPRAAAGGRGLRRPRPGRRRRAAPLRRRAARRAAGQGQPAAARAGHDRDARSRARSR